jgi:hypothetical protein
LFSGEADLLNQSGKHAKVGVIRRRIVLIPWALGLAPLLTRVASAGDPTAPTPDPKTEELKKLDQEAREAESNARQAAEARRAAKARNINTPKAATEARERAVRLHT